jgi:g-D-glutamyl-meso-diaminopimelate peptidase
VPLLLKFVEELAAAFSTGGRIFSTSAAEILDYASIYIVPAVNPDGIDLVTGALSQGEYFNNARRIGDNYPQFSFPEGWKANIQGVDLNLQYPAQWEKAREIKFSQGIISPAPADFVGSAPLTTPEARAMYDYTLGIDPALVLAYHTQGQVIYWKYDDFEPENSRDIAASFAAVSGYVAEETPYASGFAGYKDWFIESFDRPGYTIEAGLGVNPLPLSQFDEIYSRNLGILTLGALVT